MLRRRCSPNSYNSYNSYNAVYKFPCVLCNETCHVESVGHYELRSGEHIGISPFINSWVQSKKDIAVYHLLLNCNYSPIFQDFSVLCHENEKYLLELKGSLLVMRDIPSLNRNIDSASLYLFEWAFVTLFAALCVQPWPVFPLFYIPF